MRLLSFVAAAALCTCSFAHADTVYDFNAFDGVTGLPTGSLNIDFTTRNIIGEVGGIDLTGYSVTGYQIEIPGYTAFFASFFVGPYASEATPESQGTYDYFFTSPIPPNLDTPGGSGYFLETAATPEPSSLLLIATGLIGAGGILRKRFI